MRCLSGPMRPRTTKTPYYTAWNTSAWTGLILNTNKQMITSSNFSCYRINNYMFIKMRGVFTCKVHCPLLCKNSTNLGTMPVLMTSSMGGFGSLESSFLNLWVAASCASPSSEYNAVTISGTMSELPVAASPLPPTAPRPPPCWTSVN